jgi:hypothetical protein
MFGRYYGRRQVSVDNQVGDDGSVGRAQLHPFVLAGTGRGLDTSGGTRAAGRHPLPVSHRPESKVVPR